MMSVRIVAPAALSPPQAVAQVQFAPHRHSAPHRHPARRLPSVSWPQPQVQDAPAQVVQV